MNSSKVDKMFNIVKKAIDIPLMDIYNIASLIMDNVVDANRHFVVRFDWSLCRGIPHYIQAIVLAANEKIAYELLKIELNKIEFIERYANITFNHLTIEDFDIFPLYNDDLYTICEPRIEHIVIKQGYYDGSSTPFNLEYTAYEFKYRYKPQKKWINIYRDRYDYYDAHTFYPDERILSEYYKELVNDAQSSIQLLF